MRGKLAVCVPSQPQSCGEGDLEFPDELLGVPFVLHTTSEKQSNEPQSLCQKVNQCIIDNLSLRIEAPAVPVPIPKEAALTCDWSQQVAATAAASFISAKIQFL